MSDENVESSEAAAVVEALEPMVFAEPSEELARNATRELAYEERFSICKMAAGAGNTMIDVYSFPEAVNTIFGTRWDRLDVESSKAGLMWVDTAKLATWLRDVIGDVEFADAVESALEGTDHFKAQIDAMLPLFRQRVAQYQAALNEDGENG